MKTDLYAYVMAKLQASKGKLPVVARESGVPKRSLEKIAMRIVKNPGIKHIETLAAYFDGKDAELPTDVPVAEQGGGTTDPRSPDPRRVLPDRRENGG